MIKIGLLGYAGRMGQAIAAEIAASAACELAGGVVRELKPEYKKSKLLITTKADDVIAISDVAVDFTFAAATIPYAKLAAAHNKPFMTGTTGLAAKDLDELKKLAKKIPVLAAPNTSLSLAAMKQLTTLAAKLLGNMDYDIAIRDEHHRMKKDMPSGTARSLGAAVARGNAKKQASFASIRAGHIIGEHEVIFAGPGETIRLHHSVSDRAIFARGALQAALWLHGKPAGFYGMEDVLGI